LTARAAHGRRSRRPSGTRWRDEHPRLEQISASSYTMSHERGIRISLFYKEMQNTKPIV
jgi:hypothetical protein